MLARPVKPANPSARARKFVLSVGKGWTREMRPQSVSSWRAATPPFRIDGVCSYHGSDGHHVQPVPALGETVDDRTHHHASGGGVGSEVWAQHQNVHRLFLAPNTPLTTIDGATAAIAAPLAPAPTQEGVAHLRRRGPPRRRVVPRGALSSAPLQASTDNGSTSRPAPPTASGNAVGVGDDRRAAHAQRFDHGQAEPFVGRREDERSREGERGVELRSFDPARSHDPIAQPELLYETGDLVLRGPARPVSTSRTVGSARATGANASTRVRWFLCT